MSPNHVLIQKSYNLMIKLQRNNHITLTMYIFRKNGKWGENRMRFEFLFVFTLMMEWNEGRIKWDLNLYLDEFKESV